MTTVAWAAGLTIAALGLIVVLIWAGGRSRRRYPTSHLSYLGTVSQGWLTSHRAEH
jgi:hypothetical protein